MLPLLVLLTLSLYLLTKHLIYFQGENKKLAEPLRKAREQLVELQRQLGSQVSMP
jgi:hypothetical protein